jgi:hypothetical protein
VLPQSSSQVPVLQPSSGQAPVLEGSPSVARKDVGSQRTRCLFSTLDHNFFLLSFAGMHGLSY